jgi:hypothetical protein
MAVGPPWVRMLESGLGAPQPLGRRAGLASSTPQAVLWIRPAQLWDELETRLAGEQPLAFALWQVQWNALEGGLQTRFIDDVLGRDDRRLAFWVPPGKRSPVGFLELRDGTATVPFIRLLASLAAILHPDLNLRETTQKGSTTFFVHGAGKPQLALRCSAAGIGFAASAADLPRSGRWVKSAGLACVGWGQGSLGDLRRWGQRIGLQMRSCDLPNSMRLHAILSGKTNQTRQLQVDANF